VGRIRLVVLDDNLYVRTPNGIRPRSALFHRFVEAVARTGTFERVGYLAPVRDLRPGEPEPAGQALDERVLDVTPLEYFSGIADYTARAGFMLWRNWGPINRAIAEADLVWLRLPASNALIALTAARRHHVPHFAWIAGKVADVARTQPLPALAALGARVLAGVYDATTNLAASTGPAVALDGNMFASVVTQEQVDASRAASYNVRHGPPWRIVWSGRMAAEKGLPQLIEITRELQERNLDVSLSLIGDGPAQPAIERSAATLKPGTVAWHGYVSDESAYFALLREGDVFVYPTQADAVPKVVVEALAAGLPVVANDVGAISQLIGGDQRGRAVARTKPAQLADAVEELLHDPDERGRMRTNALAWAGSHTDEAQAQRLVGWLRAEFPHLAWGPN
jgi:glycosyltransferase involved in cell wall biosynthesis